VQLSVSDKAIIARKIRTAFDENKLHTSTWGRAFYVGQGCDEGNGNATALVMDLLSTAGVFADDGD
jgi:hypothetical protein